LGGRPELYLDECHDLLKKNIDYVEKCFREFRKEGASAIAITQLFSDFQKNPVGEVMLNTSHFKVIFRHDCKESEFLDEFDLSKINQLNTVRGKYSEFYLKTSEHSKILRYFMNSEESIMFCTNPHERGPFQKFWEERKDYYDFQQILDQYKEFSFVE
jgi:hypothetical protein